MGASQSSAAGGGTGAAGPAEGDFIDYYELLKVEQTASGDEIRKSYRKLALKYHPDKNPDNVEEANRIFHRLQEAYEILSDDQERAWYDQNRERLMNGDGPDFDDEEAFEAFRSGDAGPPPPPTSSSRGLTAKTLLRFFDPSLAQDFSDHDNAFFGTYRRLFERLAEEERAAAPYPGEETPVPPKEAYPSFGYSHTAYSKESAEVHQVPVKDFYTVWTNFQSRKSFGWMDQHDLRDAPDRRVKRWMEKENKRGRDVARREYNDTIRALAAFVRKRDPRYKAWQAHQAANGPNSAAEVERRKAEAERIRLEREERAKSFKAQSWQMASDVRYSDDEFSHSGSDQDGTSPDDQVGGDDDIDSEDDDYPQNDAWDCVACDKFFRSEAAFRNHEKSAKHRKAVEALRREMQQEEDELGLGLDDDDFGDGSVPLAEDVRAMGLEDYAEEDVDENADFAASQAQTKTKKKKKGGKNHQQAGTIGNYEEEVSAGFSIPSIPANAGGSKSKKQKKKDKERRKMAATADMEIDEDGFFVQNLASQKATNGSPGQKQDPTPTVVDEQPEDMWAGLEDPYIPPEAFVDQIPGPLGPGERPEGSFDVFGYGSLIFKPPPYVIGATPGFIKGYARRFAQHSIDHRGTPQRPGRVVTLVSAEDWHRFKDADDAPEGDIVWGVSYTIDPRHTKVVRAYLDYREKNGYTPQSVDIWGVRKKGDTAVENIEQAGKEGADGEASSPKEEVMEEVVIIKDALVYVGLPDNKAFVGPSPLPELAQRIFSCEGPSGRNDEYLLRLARAVRELAPQTVDTHLFELERLVLELRDGTTAIENGDTGPKSRRAKKDKKASAKERCNVCSMPFDSRSKLFNHIRETGHALATSVDADTGGKKKKGKKGKAN